MTRLADIEGPPTLDDIEREFRALIWDRNPKAALELADRMMHVFMYRSDEKYGSYEFMKREERFYEWRGMWLAMLAVVGVHENDARRAQEKKAERKQAARGRAFTRSLGLTTKRRKVS